MAATCHDCGGEIDRMGGKSALRCWDCWANRQLIANQAMAKVREAVLAGLLPNLKAEVVPCRDCGARANRYDHRDYLRPTDVEPVCHRCNIRRGPAAPIPRHATHGPELRTGRRGGLSVRRVHGPDSVGQHPITADNDSYRSIP